MLRRPILDIRNWNWRAVRAFVKESASWYLDGMWTGLIIPASTWSRTKWQSSLMCFVRSWKTRFLLKFMAAWLSQRSSTGWGCTRKIYQELEKPNDLWSGWGKGSIFCLGRWPGHCILLLRLPTNKRITEKHTIARDRSSSVRTSGPIRVTVCSFAAQFSKHFSISIFSIVGHHSPL